MDLYDYGSVIVQISMDKPSDQEMVDDACYAFIVLISNATISMKLKTWGTKVAIKILFND